MHDLLNGVFAWALQAQTTTGPGGIPREIIFPVAAMAILFYFVVWRPQKTEQRKRDEMIDQIAKGDAVVTIGGIHGTVESYDKPNGVVVVAVAPKISMRFNRSAISTVASKKGKKEDEKASDKAAQA